MGAWGMSPFENDAYGDASIDVAHSVAPTLLKKLNSVVAKAQTKSADANDRWAAIGLVIVAYQSTYLDSDQMFPLIESAHGLFADLDQDDEWKGSWRNPRAFKTMFAAVNQELQDMRESYNEHSPKLVQLLFTDFEKAPAVRKRR